ncbi:MAG: ABC transporter ATP-binding protein [bacterium]|nr:ABC transporter ATP-binding protein [bacterium]
MLEVRNLTKVFFSDRANPQEGFIALHEVNFTVEEGEFICLLGPSGCGKTTLLRLIAGLLPAERRQIITKQGRVQGLSKERCMVFQNFGLFPWRTVMDNVALSLELAGVPRPQREQASREALEMVGLSGFEMYWPHQISGGMQQRVGIARALTQKPSYLLMDEPFGALDAQTRERMQEELLRLWMHTRFTVLFVTHSIDEAIYLSDRVLVMGTHPGDLRQDIRIDLPRPRWTYDVKADPLFVRLRSEINVLLRDKEEPI